VRKGEQEHMGNQRRTYLGDGTSLATLLDVLLELLGAVASFTRLSLRRRDSRRQQEVFGQVVREHETGKYTRKKRVVHFHQGHAKREGSKQALLVGPQGTENE
jgi:hypothetical protein